jgi:hypothetical protein
VAPNLKSWAVKRPLTEVFRDLRRTRDEGAFGLDVLGDEKARTGRGAGRSSELEEVEMTDAFLDRSARVGGNVGSGGTSSIDTI